MLAQFFFSKRICLCNQISFDVLNSVRYIIVVDNFAHYDRGVKIAERCYQDFFYPLFFFLSIPSYSLQASDGANAIIPPFNLI